MHCTFLHFYLKEGPKGSEKTPHTAKIVMKFLLYDKVKYFYQHFSLVAFGAQWKNSTDMPAASRKSGKTEGWAVGDWVGGRFGTVKSIKICQKLFRFRILCKSTAIWPRPQVYPWPVVYNSICLSKFPAKHCT